MSQTCNPVHIYNQFVVIQTLLINAPVDYLIHLMYKEQSANRLQLKCDDILYVMCSALDWERSGLLGGIPRVVVQISALL